jgi:hypothetical protein
MEQKPSVGRIVHFGHPVYDKDRTAHSVSCVSMFASATHLARGRGAMSRMVRCLACGFNVEHYDVHDWGEVPGGVTVSSVSYPTECATCRLCEECPRMRESYRRGFNAGLDALAEAVTRIVRDTTLRRSP